MVEAPLRQSVAVPQRSARPFAILAAAFPVLLVGSNLATPLYAVYRERFGFSSLVLTLVFTTYTIVLVPSLLVFGQVSDRVGRRRVIVTGLCVSALGLLVFAVADATAWLFAARAVQGLAVGMATGAATAGLVELEPHGDRARAALFAVLAQAGGSSLGPLLAGVLAQWAPAPRVLCYVVVLVLTLLAAAAVLTLPESRRESGGPWRMQRPSVPEDIRAGFWRASLTATTVWVVAALFLSVVPSYAAKLLDTSNLALLGAIAASLLAASCVAQVLAARRVDPVRAQPAGLVLVAAGLVALVLAFPLHSLAALFTSAILGGAGHGLAFLGSQAEVNELAPIERRGEVTAAFISVIYCGVAVSVIGVGVLATVISLRTGVTVFAAVAAATAAGTTWWHVEERRRRRRLAHAAG
jgi:MFS family permease